MSVIWIFILVWLVISGACEGWHWLARHVRSN